METYKIFGYVDSIIDAYKEPVQRLPGLLRKPREIINQVEFYTNNKYLSGERDELGREKPFYNVCNFRVTVAKTGTDLDVKDLRFEADALKDSIPAMLINHELYKVLKEINFSETLNDMGVARPKYGGVLVKKSEIEDFRIDVVEWINVEFDRNDVVNGVIIERHYMSASEFSKKAGIWENVDEVLKTHTKMCKGKPMPIEIMEVHGEFPENMYPGQEDSEGFSFERMCFYMACVGKKKFLVYYEKEKVNPYKYLAWEKVGNGLGRGVVEEGFMAQWAINDSMLAMKSAMELAGKVVLATTSKKVKGNAITGVDNGHIFELEDGKTITSLNLMPSAMPQFQNMIALWQEQYNRVASSYDANTGEAPTAGTPYSQTALLNQVANTPFEYQREVWGIFLNEILNDWILPYVKKRILKAHYLVSEFTAEELEIIDADIKTLNVNNMKLGMMKQVKVPTPMDQMMMEEMVGMELKKHGMKREIEIPAKYLDVEGKITANISGELKNKSAMLQSLSQIARDIQASYNPQTGEYMALKDQTLSQIYGSLVEMSGAPLSFGMLRGLKATKPTMANPMQTMQPMMKQEAMPM